MQEVCSQDQTLDCNQTVGHSMSTLTRTGSIQKPPPKPPTRTTSSLSSGTSTIKKRVQIQEITV